MQNLLEHAPDIVVMHQDAPDTILFEHAAAVGRLAPKPVIVFTLDPDAENIARAMAAGVHAYVIDGYNPARLRSVVHLAQARFQHERLLREELAQVSQRFEERKLVDRAKGILMGARQLREDEAYRVLRRVAMHTKQRIGQVSRRVIDAARYGEAINRAGQLRMVSQRLVAAYALIAMGTPDPAAPTRLADSTSLVDATLAMLGKSLSRPTFGDLVEAVGSSWQALKALLGAPASVSRLAEIDRAADAVLLRSEQLTDNLEVSGFATALHVINVAGRQRMLSQRHLKATLLATALDGALSQAAHAAAEASKAALEEGFAYLRDLPLTNPEIAGSLERAILTWDKLRDATRQSRTKAGRAGLAALSETLLEQLDRLTTDYERAMQAFID